jgi:hypothetical protein
MPWGRITWLRRARDVRRAPQVLDSLPSSPVPSHPCFQFVDRTKDLSKSSLFEQLVKRNDGF